MFAHPINKFSINIMIGFEINKGTNFYDKHKNTSIHVESTELDG